MRRMLHTLWERWKVIARKIGDVQSRVMLVVFYFLILAPFGLAVRAFSDPLQLKQRSFSGWLPKERKTTAPWDRARRQF
jgi:hypothetical protein